MALFKTLTQGGQVHIHQLRMFKQVFYAALLGAFLTGGGYFGWLCYHFPASYRSAIYYMVWSEVILATNPSEAHHRIAMPYFPPKGQSYRRRCLDIVRDPFLKDQLYAAKMYLKESAQKSAVLGALIFLSILSLWFFLGLKKGKTNHQRGSTFAPWKDLRKALKKRRQASDIKLARPWWKGGGKLPLVKNKETSHILVTGTTSSGKTNLFHHLLPQIRRRSRWGRPDRAIVVDVTGDYISRYYDPETDVLLNPLDTRSLPWHPWADCHLEAHYDVFAETLIKPKPYQADPFWDTASRLLLKTALQKYEYLGMFGIQHLTNFLLSSPNAEFEAFFKDTAAATLSSQSNEKTTLSIRSTLSSQISCLKHLTSPEDSRESFSLRKWVMNNSQPGWLFITARPDQRKTLAPLMSAWVDIALNALMVLPEDPKRRLWLIIDELAALQKLPGLTLGLAEGRKYGGCLLVGFQSKPQLEDMYGKSTAEAMLDLFNTKIFFRCTEPATQMWISKVLGEKEEIEPNENISYGAHSMRDGVSLSYHRHQVPLILPSELSLLKDLECYLKYPGDYPATKFQTKYKKPHLKTAPFILTPERKAEFSSHSGAFQELSPEEEGSIKDFLKEGLEEKEF